MHTLEASSFYKGLETGCKSLCYKAMETRRESVRNINLGSLYNTSVVCMAVFSLGLYQRAQCPLGLLMCPLGLAQNQNVPFGVLADT